MKKIILSILLISEMLMIGTVYSKTINKNISDELLRMHILANSDNEFDQSLKIKVRDFLIKYINEEKLASKEDVIQSIKNMQTEIDNLLMTEGVMYSCKVSLSNSMFDTRTYSDLSIPAGNYETIKVLLGDGKGKNWWCIAYPPLCFTESLTGKMSDKGKKELKAILNDETFNTINSTTKEYKVKFKTVEIFNSLLQKIN